MGNSYSDGTPPATRQPRQRMDSGIFTDYLQTKIRLMGALSHDFRTRAEERANIRERLAEMKAERRRISVDLRRERRVSSDEPTDPAGLESHSGVTRDTNKPAWAAYESDKICAQCLTETPREKNYPCRVCTRVFHPECLKKCGECRPADLEAAARALSNVGWSCFHCSNLSALLTEEEIEEIIHFFEIFDKDQDNQVSWEEYRRARGGLTGESWAGGDTANGPRRMSTMTETVIKLEFTMADQDGDHALNWWEFLNLAAQHQLGKRSQVELVNLLTDKEVIKAKSVFNELDKDRDGVVTGLEARRAVRKWCSPLNNGLSPDAVAKLSPAIDSHVEVRARMLVDGGDQQRDMITWSDFLAEQALYILCSRPNMAPNPLNSLPHHDVNCNDKSSRPGKGAGLTRENHCRHHDVSHQSSSHAALDNRRLDH